MVLKMNQKIKEFFSEATFEPDRLVDGVYHPYIPLQFSNEPWRYTITDDGIQKFAELIVKECASICEHRYTYMNKDMSEGAFEAMDCHDSILEHFGIEE